MKIKLNVSCILGGGKRGKAGEEVEVSDSVGSQLIGSNMATLAGKSSAAAPAAEAGDKGKGKKGKGKG